MKFIQYALASSYAYHSVCGWRVCSNHEKRLNKRMLLSQKIGLSALNGVFAPLMIPIDIMRAEIALTKRLGMDSYFLEPLELMGFFEPKDT